MTRDYKLRTHSRRPRTAGKARILAAIGVLAATFGAVKLFDLDAAAFEMSAHAESLATISQPLVLPEAAAGPVAAPDGEDIRAVQAEPVTPPLQSTAQQPPDQTVALLRTEQPTGQAPAELSADPSAISLHDETGPDAVTAAMPAESRLPETVDPADGEETNSRWVEHRVASGESLARIFDRQGLDATLLHNIVNSSPEANKLAQLRPGQKIRFQFDENRELARLELHRNRVESIRVTISDDGIASEEISKDVETRVASAAGVIESSLFVDGQKAGLSDGQIMGLATIFGWDIDFALEIRAGDQFRVLYEELYLDGEKLRDGAILAAEFINRGTTYRAVRYEDDQGEIGYYDADGQSKRRAFIRTPIKFARVSSRFNPKRWHPILKKWRSHKGVDYAAPTGTPVKATGDGRVVFRGTKNGYGKTVILEHAGKYTTLYAHLSGYSKRALTGKRVKQGQVIGYVGKTGLASGPHLHYEFRMHGEHRDPLRVKLPKSLSLPKSEIARFRRTTSPLLAQLEGIPTETMVASAPGSRATP